MGYWAGVWWYDVRLSAHQPAYLPWPGLLHKIASCDLFLTLDNVQYERGSFTNRNRIRTREGSQWLTVPVISKGHTGSTVGQLRVDQSDKRWRRKHENAIRMNYQKAPHWITYEADVAWQLSIGDAELLEDYTRAQLDWLTDIFEIGDTCHLASRYKPEGEGWRMILDLCKKTGADEFLFGAQGRNYLTEEGGEAFKEAGVKPLFQRYEPVEYRQCFDGWVPGLSALDLLLNCGPVEGREILMRGGSIEE